MLVLRCTGTADGTERHEGSGDWWWRAMSQAIDVGQVIAKRYLIIESLGKGGMANVWLARDVRLGKLWAIKEIKPNAGGARGRILRQAIIDEANLMKRLDHPAIPRVVDIMDVGSTLFVVMDYVDGRELGGMLRLQGHPFRQEEVIGWGVQLCDVLGYLHAQSPAIIYRDVKPSNVMLRDDGSVRLIDFGICMERSANANNDGRIVGTPGYAAPEQVPQPMPHPRPRRLDPACVVDERADVYALGATLYTLVTGHVPKRVTDTWGVEQVSFDMRPIRSWDPGLSEGLERILTKATMRDPGKRYASMVELRYDLEHHEELTDEWRQTQLRKVMRFRLLRRSAFAACALGVLCVTLGLVVKGHTYESLMRRARAASPVSTGSAPSEAERLYEEALELRPRSLDPYRGLLEVYEHDFRLTQGEDDRLREAFMGVDALAHDRGYAQLCFDVGVAYLSYYGIEQSGGSVGNVAVASVDAATPWFERVLEVCGNEGSERSQLIDDVDVRAAKAYGIVSSFYEQVTRAGREGRGAVAEYRAFWDSLQHVLEEQNRADDAHRHAEGVRLRLCQVATQALSSTTYLAGFARAGITRDEANSLLATVRASYEGLGEFARADEYQVVYGPVCSEIEQGMDLAQTNIQNVYANSVVSQGGEVQ